MWPFKTHKHEWKNIYKRFWECEECGLRVLKSGYIAEQALALHIDTADDGEYYLEEYTVSFVAMMANQLRIHESVLKLEKKLVKVALGLTEAEYETWRTTQEELIEEYTKGD